MDRYEHDPMEQDPQGPDDTPFPGGSTEQKDVWLADRGQRLGQTAVGSPAFRAAYDTALAALMAPAPAPVIDEAEEAAALLALAHQLRHSVSLHAFRGDLFAERRHQVARPLTPDEVVRIDTFARTAWAAFTTERVA